MQGQDYISTSSFDDNTIIRKMDVRTLASSWALVLASPDQRAWLSNLQQIALIFFRPGPCPVSITFITENIHTLMSYTRTGDKVIKIKKKDHGLTHNMSLVGIFLWTITAQG